MKTKFLFAIFLAAFFGIGTSMAAEVTSFQDQLANKSPVYLLVELGNAGVGTNTSYNGAIDVVGGKIAVAKDILIEPDETLAGDLGEVGTLNNKISFIFSTPFYKGLVLKVFPDKQFVMESTSAQFAHLSFSERVGKKSQEVLTIPFSDLLSNGSFAGGDYRVTAIYFDKMADLEERNAQFIKKLAIASDMQNILRFAREAVLAGKIDETLYAKFDLLAESAWQSYDADLGYFQWRYRRLKTYFSKNKATPALIYGGLSQLMKKMLP